MLLVPAKTCGTVAVSLPSSRTAVESLNLYLVMDSNTVYSG